MSKNKKQVRKHRDEEFAGELTASAPRTAHREKTEEQENVRGIGWIAVILSVLSLFLLPILLAPAGIILGIVTGRRGSNLGWWAVGIGVVSFILMIFTIPFRMIF